VVFLAAAAYGRTILEAVNYFEHYGLVREPDQPVEPRHSWNTNRRLSNAVLFNLARHSHHHAQGDAQYWQLRAYRDAPTLPYGYLTCMLLVYIAPVWYRNRMTPLVLEWDRRYASPAERRLAAAANRASGLRELSLATEAG
jgi:alkane 1-monooxygenase